MVQLVLPLRLFKPHVACLFPLSPCVEMQRTIEGTKGKDCGLRITEPQNG
ncbi:hypothetical protein RLOC_00012383 [Lonchura striata]|uniref:Uncharacterized protein n=1 Tax=Lonchura striata TaxID=40157 RepID=A0A218V7N5_9PASE|nr:hypothetical protein RLOC_00012383 [Lonchura striata domestica]